MRGRSLVAALLVAVAGCIGPDPPAGPGDGPAGLGPQPLLLVSAPTRVDDTQRAREPAITQAADGTLFVSGYWGPSRYSQQGPGGVDNLLQTALLWSSRDGGASFQRVDVGTPLDGALGNSDVDLAAGADGRVHLASMVYTHAGGVHSIHTGSSADGGGSWTWARIASGQGVDRPWVRVHPEGTSHIVWNDSRVVRHAVSSDVGRSWQERPVVHAGGAGGFAVLPDGTLAVRIVPVSANAPVFDPANDGVAVSVDGGDTWTWRTLPGNRTWLANAVEFFAGDDEVARIWDPLAADGGGALHAAWAEGDEMRLATSLDHGETWRVTAIPGGGRTFYPYLCGGRVLGTVGLTWFSFGADGAVAAHAAVVRETHLPGPSVGAAVLEPDTGSADHGEYFECVMLADDVLAAAVPVLRADGQWLDYRVASLAGP